jgi:hypothetical protein
VVDCPLAGTPSVYLKHRSTCYVRPLAGDGVNATYDAVAAEAESSRSEVNACRLNSLKDVRYIICSVLLKVAFLVYTHFFP